MLNRHLAVLPLLALIAGGVPAAACAQVVPAPAQGAYHSAFIDHRAFSREVFEDQLAQKKLAIEMDYRGWDINSSFPTADYEAVSRGGVVPHLTWEPWAGAINDPKYGAQQIIDGKFDPMLHRWAAGIKTWGKPIMIRLGHEMNGNWYPWGGANNGGGTLTGFGDPTKPDGPERYIGLYRHVVDLFRADGVTNVTWIWCPDVNGIGDQGGWNKAENYYPGDDVVDWIGLDGYNWGTKEPNFGGFQSFGSIFKKTYDKFSGKGKPMMIGEFSSAEEGGDKGLWILSAYSTMQASYPMIKAVTWFQISKERDWRVNSSSNALSSYRTVIASPYFVDHVDFSTTAVGDDRTRPTGFALLPANPNPFNPTTAIGYQLSAVSNVKLEVFDTLGHRVRTLVDETKAAGQYTATFDAAGLPSGIYLVRLESAGRVQSQRLTLVR